MANEQVSAGPSLPLSDVAAAIAKGIADGMKQNAEVTANAIAEGMAKNAPPRKIEFGEFDGKSPFDRLKNGTQLKAGEKEQLTRKCFQNQSPLKYEYLLPEEIALLNKITRPGRYLNRKVEVVIREDGSESVLELRYNNKSADQRSELKSEAKNLETILQRIVDEQTEAELETATKPAHRK